MIAPVRHVVRSGTVELAVHVAGEGPAVLLLHGFPDDHAVWRHQIDALVAAGYRAIAPDNRGCGESAVPSAERDYRIERLVEDVVAVLDHFAVAQCPLVAHDWGALIGWHLCMRHPERISRYVALSVGHPTAYATAPLRQKLMGWYVLAFQLRGLAEWALRAGDWFALRRLTNHTEADRWVERLSRPGRLTAALRYYRANIGFVWPRAWPGVSMPVLGVWSDGDIALCREQMERSARFVEAGWRFEALHGASHWLQLDRPDEVSHAILRFLAGNDAPASERPRI